MEIFQIVAFALVAVVLSVILRKDRPEIAIQISIVVGIAIFLLLIFKISAVLSLLREIASKINIDSVYLIPILKIAGIAYITTFGAEVCRDAGEGAIASKVEFAGKILIMVLAVPVLMAVLETMLTIMP
ncbi:MAG TPA: stage III sporulation protein AD [Clostridiaceae bacterium]|nr:stage III sporulation protein AD [Clostridiaceae bacterium]